MANTIKSPFGTVVIDPDDPSLLESVFGSRQEEKTHRHRNIDMTPAADIYEDDQKFHIWIDLPGVEKESIQVSITGQILAVSAETKKLNLKGGYWMRHERAVGTYIRRLQLNQSIESDTISAQYSDGTLMLTIAKPQQHESKSIDVKIE